MKYINKFTGVKVYIVEDFDTFDLMETLQCWRYERIIEADNYIMNIPGDCEIVVDINGVKLSCFIYPDGDGSDRESSKYLNEFNIIHELTSAHIINPKYEKEMNSKLTVNKFKELHSKFFRKISFCSDIEKAIQCYKLFKGK